MQLDQLPTGNVMVLYPTAGHLDAGNVKAFRQAIAPVLKDHRRVVLDMALLDFVDSSGVGALIACLRTSKESQGEFRLCNLSRPVRALFDLMRMHRVFDIHTDRDEALRSMGMPSA